MAHLFCEKFTEWVLLNLARAQFSSPARHVIPFDVAGDFAGYHTALACLERAGDERDGWLGFMVNLLSKDWVL